MPDMRYRGKSKPLPEELWSDSKNEYQNNRDSDPDFHLNYSSSEETGWSTETNESSNEEEEPC